MCKLWPIMLLLLLTSRISSMLHLVLFPECGAFPLIYRESFARRSQRARCVTISRNEDIHAQASPPLQSVALTELSNQSNSHYVLQARENPQATNPSRRALRGSINLNSTDLHDKMNLNDYCTRVVTGIKA